MSQHDFEVENASGRIVRKDLNEALQALVTKCSGPVEPEVTKQFQNWIDTSGAFPIWKLRNANNDGWIILGRMDQPYLGLNYIHASNTAPEDPRPFQYWVDTNLAIPWLKMRNLGNTAWVTIGRVDQNNYGLLPLTGGNLSGPIQFTNKDFIRLPSGNTAERPGAGLPGMLRYNNELGSYEGFQVGGWKDINRPGFEVKATQTIGEIGAASLTTIDQRQLIPIQGSGEPITLNNKPFGDLGGWKDGAEILLVGLSDEWPITIVKADESKGVVGDFVSYKLGKWNALKLVWHAGLDRFIVQGFLKNFEELIKPKAVSVGGTGAVNIDWSLSAIFHASITAATNFTFLNAQEGMTISLVVMNNSAADHTINFVSVLKKPETFDLTIKAGKISVFTIMFVNGLYIAVNVTDLG